MGISNLAMLFNVNLYVILFLFSILSFIPLIINDAHFNGHCLLFATGNWSETSYLSVNWGDSSYCSYSKTIPILSMLFSLFYIFWLSIHLFKDYDLSWLSSFVSLIVSCSCVMLFMISGIILSAGFKKWCSLLAANHMECNYAEFIKFEMEKDISKVGYYVEFGMATFCTWVCFLGWMLATAITSRNLYNLHKEEDFMVTAERERGMLIQSLQRRAYST